MMIAVNKCQLLCCVLGKVIDVLQLLLPWVVRVLLQCCVLRYAACHMSIYVLVFTMSSNI